MVPDSLDPSEDCRPQAIGRIAVWFEAYTSTQVEQNTSIALTSINTALATTNVALNRSIAQTITLARLFKVEKWHLHSVHVREWGMGNGVGWVGASFRHVVVTCIPY